MMVSGNVIEKMRYNRGFNDGREAGLVSVRDKTTAVIEAAVQAENDRLCRIIQMGQDKPRDTVLALLRNRSVDVDTAKQCLAGMSGGSDASYDPWADIRKDYSDPESTHEDCSANSASDQTNHHHYEDDGDDMDGDDVWAELRSND